MKDAKGHGSNKRPLAGHAYHSKSDAELRYIVKDASEAASASQSMGKLETKYNDQINDAATVLGYRDRGGTSDHPDAVAARSLASGAKSAPAPVHDAQRSGYNEHGSRHGYNPESVNNAIKNNRTGKIGSKEASAIHRLLKGR